jgi:LysR family transcriptional regulator, regulator for bpeEF and oprC
MKPRYDLNALQTFAVALHSGSMAKAALVLNLPKSTISRHLAKIEHTAGVTLIRRVPHGIEPTLEGKLLFDRIADSISALQASTATAPSEEIGKHSFQSFKPLRIRAPVVFGSEFLPPVISDAIRKFPELRYDLVLTGRFFDAADEAYDINFCVGIDVPFDMESWPLGQLEAKLYASPDYAKSHPINSPYDLAKCTLITTPCPADTTSTLTLTSPLGQRVSLNTPPAVVTNDNSIILHLVQEGQGIARLPAFLAAPYVTQGVLEPVLPDWTVDRHQVMIAAKRGYRQPVVQAFLEYAASKLSQALSPA